MAGAQSGRLSERDGYEEKIQDQEQDEEKTGGQAETFEIRGQTRAEKSRAKAGRQTTRPQGAPVGETRAGTARDRRARGDQGGRAKEIEIFQGTG
jgi:hypothetical protein